MPREGARYEGGKTVIAQVTVGVLEEGCPRPGFEDTVGFGQTTKGMGSES